MNLFFLISQRHAAQSPNLVSTTDHNRRCAAHREMAFDVRGVNYILPEHRDLRSAPRPVRGVALLGYRANRAILTAARRYQHYRGF